MGVMEQSSVSSNSVPDIPLAAKEAVPASLSRWLFFAGFVLIGLLAAAALLRSTPYGLGLVNDSASYVNGAQNLLAGNGYTRTSGGGEIKAITHFPPLFSIILGLLGVAGIDYLQGARGLIAVLFGLDAVLLGLLVYQLSRSRAFALLAALLLAVSDTFLKVYAYLLSEPLYLTLMLGTFLLLGLYFKDKSKKWLIASGILIGLSYMARYAGISLLFTVLIALILLRGIRKTNLHFPFRPAAILITSFLFPVLSWSVINALISPQVDSGLIGNRQFAWHPISLSVLFNSLKNLLTWSAPDVLLKSLPLLGSIISLLSLLSFGLLILWLAWTMWRRWKHQQASTPKRSRISLAFTLGMHIPVYLAFLIFSISFLDASTPLDDRIFTPIFVAGLALFCSGLAWLWSKTGGEENKKNKTGKSLVVLTVCGFLVLTGLLDGQAVVKDMRREGLGFAHRGTSQSPALQVIKGMPESLVLYSNRPTALLLLANRPAYILPARLDPVTQQLRPDFQTQLDEMQAQIISGKAALVIFGMRNSDDPQEVEDFEAITGGLPVFADFGGIIIFYEGE